MTVTKERIKEVELSSFADKIYYKYGVATLEDRAIPDFRDGLIPVTRRLLWASYGLGLSSKSRFVKSARVVGETLGKYHPHGESAYDALVGLTNVGETINNVCVGLFQGDSNFGSLSNRSYAASRYTELRLSKFSDTVLFNKFYMPVVAYGPNYDSSEKEPITLPALLPVLLLNGKFGIATGATTNIPAFKYESVLKLLKAIFGGEEVTDRLLYKHLKYTTTYGGSERPLASSLAKKERLESFKIPKGKIKLWSNVHLSEPKTITVTEFAVSSLERLLEKLNDRKEFPHVKLARDDSSTKDKYGRLTVILYPDTGTKDIDLTVKKVDQLLSVSETFSMNLTERYLDETEQIAARLSVRPLVQLIKDWVAWRIDLEKRACSYWIGEADKRIRRFELLMLAVDNRKLITDSLDKPLTAQQLYEWLAKRLRITVDEAKFIYDQKIIQLRKLEKTDLQKQMREVQAEKKTLEQRRKNPSDDMLTQLDEFSQLI